MTIKEARLFVTRFISGEYTPEEHGAFLEWMQKASFDDLNSIMTEYEDQHETWVLGKGPSSEWIGEMEEKLNDSERKKKEAPIRMTRLIRRRMGWVAAASVIGLIGVLIYSNSQKAGQVSTTSEKTANVLSNKSLVVPKGSQQQIVLADGSKIWLNSASTLNYPAEFSGKERVVELSGEAYFEIAENASMPFRVKVRDMNIDVLGTSFNVKAYEEDGASKTALVTGALRVDKGTESVLLHPGEQAEVPDLSPASGKSIIVTSGLDVQRTLAWKDGYLHFSHDQLRTVMNDIARCYDLELKYVGNISEAATFSGKFSRAEDIHKILKDLQFSHVHATINGKVISVMP